MKQSFIEGQKTRLIKKFHTLLGQAGINNEGKLAMLAAYGVETSKDLNVYELTELCGRLDGMVNPAHRELDVWRKRLIGAIGKYLIAMGSDAQDMARIQAIACRAAKAEAFNRIPKDRLISLYNAFNKRTRDLKNVGEDMPKECLPMCGTMAEA